MLTLLSPAKLNLFLHITGRRADGYHNLQTLFQLLDYGDTLQFTHRKGADISLSPPIAGVPAQDNLIIKAAQQLQALSQCHQGVHIELQKNVPLGGGLGGGSSNAATSLLALNQLWQLGFSQDKLAAIGLSLGADVPVFIRGRTAFAEGVGELLHPIDLATRWYVVIKPPVQVNTAEIFAHKQLTRNTPPITIPSFFAYGGHNDCAAVVRKLHPAVNDAFVYLAQYGSAHLTGTGACVFNAFDKRAAAESVLKYLPKGWQGFVAQGVNQSPTHQQLYLKNVK